MPVILATLAIVGFLVHFFVSKHDRSSKRAVELLLVYLLVINIGLGGILAWFGHTFMADEIARKIGWAPGSPFQFEVAVADLSWGVCGVLCSRFRNGFITATGLGSSIFFLGCAFGHIRQILEHDNLAVYNAGPILWIGDLGIPVLVLSLLAIRYFQSRSLAKCK